LPLFTEKSCHPAYNFYVGLGDHEEDPMEITVEKVMAAVPVAVVSTHGDLDASNYMELVAKAQEVYRAGARDLLLDLGDTQFVSSSGLVALHSIALLMRGERPLDPESGWDAIHAMDRNVESGMQKHVKLLNPQERVKRTLERTGLTEFFQVFSNREEALASFPAESAEATTG
jgi:anti-anti-sigma regulatory factor